LKQGISGGDQSLPHRDRQVSDHDACAQALERLTEAYLSLGIVKEAQTSAAVLGYNYRQPLVHGRLYAPTDQNIAPAEDRILDQPRLRAVF
jgi:hypothetical protein